MNSVVDAFFLYNRIRTTEQNVDAFVDVISHGACVATGHRLYVHEMHATRRSAVHAMAALFTGLQGPHVPLIPNISLLQSVHELLYLQSEEVTDCD